jgi:quinol monooxygenase YgiN
MNEALRIERNLMLSIRSWLLALLVFVPVASPGSVMAQADAQQYVVVYAEFLPATTAEGGRQLERLAELAREASGIISFNVNQEIQRPNFYSLVEIWEDAAAFQAFNNSSQTQAALNALQPLLEAPLDERPGNLAE